jgi:hypothetical protein
MAPQRFCADTAQPLRLASLSGRHGGAAGRPAPPVWPGNMACNNSLMPQRCFQQNLCNQAGPQCDIHAQALFLQYAI